MSAMRECPRAEPSTLPRAAGAGPWSPAYAVAGLLGMSEALCKQRGWSLEDGRRVPAIADGGAMSPIEDLRVTRPAAADVHCKEPATGAANMSGENAVTHTSESERINCRGLRAGRCPRARCQLLTIACTPMVRRIATGRQQPALSRLCATRQPERSLVGGKLLICRAGYRYRGLAFGTDRSWNFRRARALKAFRSHCANAMGCRSRGRAASVAGPLRRHRCQSAFMVPPPRTVQRPVHIWSFRVAALFNRRIEVLVDRN